MSSDNLHLPCGDDSPSADGTALHVTYLPREGTMKDDSDNEELVLLLVDKEEDVEKEKPATTSNNSKKLSLELSALLASTYCITCVAQFLLISYSKTEAKKDKSKAYDNAAAVFLIELVKWVFSVGAMYYRTGKFLPITVFTEGSWRVGIFYAIPSAIYALYNNLTFFNLSIVDPGSYQVYMQTRVLFTGVLYSWILKKSLTTHKWFGLTVLTAGVIMKNIKSDLEVNPMVVFVFFQASLSAFAGVYNEYLLKKDMDMDVNESNFFMYSFALIFNLAYGLIANPTYYTEMKFFSNFNGILLGIVVLGGTIGIVTSLLLKYLNVIVKAFASACEVMLTAVAAHVFLDGPLTGQDLVACCIVMSALYIYYTNPKEPPIKSASPTSEV